MAELFGYKITKSKEGGVHLLPPQPLMMVR